MAYYNTAEYTDDDVYEVRGSFVPEEVVEEHDGVVASDQVIGREYRNDEVVSGEDASENLGSGHRSHRPSILLKDFVTYSAGCVPDPIPTTPVSQIGSSGTSIYPI